MKAIWQDTTIAESDDTVVVEGNHYFSLSAVQRDALQDSDTTSICPWKGTAHYYHVLANSELNRDAAWYYPEPKEAATQIKDRIAFWRGVSVSD